MEESSHQEDNKLASLEATFLYLLIHHLLFSFYFLTTGNGKKDEGVGTGEETNDEEDKASAPPLVSRPGDN